MRKIKVWFVGGEDVRFRLPLLFALRERGYEVGAVGTEKGDSFRDAGVPYKRYNLKRWISPLSDLRSGRQLYRLFQQSRPDVVHASDTKPTFLAPVAALKAGVPARIRTITGMGYVFSSNSLLALALRPGYRFLHRRASRATSMTIFQNAEDREYFVRHGMVQPGRDALVRGSGIDVDHLVSVRPDPGALAGLRRELSLDGKIVVTMVTRLVVQKGVREYLEAASRVRREKPDVAFLLVGPQSSEGRQAVSLDEVRRRSEDVNYLGPRADVPALLALSDLFVLPSYYREGVPRSLLEAGAMGLPLITCDMPGCRDVVRHGWNGSLVPPRDARELSSAILRLLASREQLALMGARSRLHVSEHFSLQSVADAYAGIYERALTEREMTGPIPNPP